MLNLPQFRRRHAPSTDKKLERDKYVYYNVINPEERGQNRL